jgi:hypothetical protein
MDKATATTAAANVGGGSITFPSIDVRPLPFEFPPFELRLRQEGWKRGESASYMDRHEERNSNVPTIHSLSHTASAATGGGGGGEEGGAGNGREPFYYDRTTPDPDLRPFIDAETPLNVTVVRGKTAVLACVVRNLGTASVSPN